MPSPFDTLRNGVFGLAERTFGYPAAWVSQDGLVSYEGRVLFKHPATEYQLAGVETDPSKYMIEYLIGEFPGLKERIELANRNSEQITVDGSLYTTLDVIEVRDGKTIRVTLAPAVPIPPITAP